MGAKPLTLFQGSFVHTPTLGALEILEDHLLAFNDTGFITHIAPIESPESLKLLNNTPVPPVLIPDGSFLLPTFCDLHLHAPQFLYQGNGLDLPLMEWLDKYTFKAEEGLDADPALAKKVYTQLARRLIENGTGTILLFGTIKEETNLILAEAMQEAGIRSFVGKLSMDISSRPTYVEKSSEDALASASSFVRRCRNLVSHLPSHRRLVEPVLTPRFVPTCSDELLSGLGQISEVDSVRIQSHLAESLDEVEWVRSERGAEDIDIFDKSNLLTPRTIQAHCTFLSQSNFTYISSKGTSIAHCPLSNAYFSAEPFRLREALQRDVKIGLGTDIAGGYSLDIMNAMRQAVAVSRIREGRKIMNHLGNPDDPHASEGNLAVDWKESLYLATRGGSIALGLKEGSGMFTIGAPFDAQHICIYDTSSCSGVGPLDFFDVSPCQDGRLKLKIDMIEKWWCIGDVRNRPSVWVQGMPVLPEVGVL